MLRTFIIGGRVYEMQSPSVNNIIKAMKYLENWQVITLKMRSARKVNVRFQKDCPLFVERNFRLPKAVRKNS